MRGEDRSHDCRVDQDRRSEPNADLLDHGISTLLTLVAVVRSAT